MADSPNANWITWEIHIFTIRKGSLKADKRMEMQRATKMYLLQAAKTAANIASARSQELYDLLARAIEELHRKWSTWPITV